MANTINARPARKYVDDLVIEDARIFSTNFAGLEKSYNGRVVNGAGNRTFCVNIPNIMTTDENGNDIPLSEAMINDGWKVKIHRNSDEQDGPSSCFIPVKVRFDVRPPEMWLVTGRKRTKITEDIADTLDGRTFDKVNLVIHPWVRTDPETGDPTITAYLAEGWFYMHQSPFAQAWEDEQETLDNEEVSF